MAKVKEFPPEEYAAYHGITHESKKEKDKYVQIAGQGSQSLGQ